MRSTFNRSADADCDMPSGAFVRSGPEDGGNGEGARAVTDGARVTEGWTLLLDVDGLPA